MEEGSTTATREAESPQLSESPTSSSSSSSWRPRPLAFRPYSPTLHTNTNPQHLRVVVRRPSIRRFVETKQERISEALIVESSYNLITMVVKAQEQVVAGTIHHLTLEVIDAGKKKLYETKIWVKPWEDFMQVQEFKHVGDVPSFTSSDLGAKKGTDLIHFPLFNFSASFSISADQFLCYC
ncbi:hypothetical protein SASPL_118333 [Salvia splendens]|uniref:Cysteine proteinase inhibitor n=1 Tax=Salvia splendens TaxID=180675 RepID=A0A8X8XWJ9_SALSN|nr:hypothetical protein SASPL_118333 [Salvia splendens]